MFAAIRGGLGNSMYRMRPRRMLGLFLFEFFVVVLGVLAAQVVQESVKEHDRQRHTEQELERLSQAYVGTQQAGVAWRAAIGTVVALMAGVRFTNGLLWGGIAGAVIAWALVAWCHRRALPSG